MILKGKKVNFLGDSITEGAGVSCDEARFSDILARECEFAEMRNYGIGGTRIAEQRIVPGEWVDERDYCRRYKTMDPDADIIVVFGGTNDYGHGNADFGTPDAKTPETYCGALNYLMRGLIEMYPTSEIVFLTPIQREGGSNPNSRGYTLKMYSDAIKEAAARYALPVLDLYEMSGICPDIEAQRVALCPDGLHPNDEGHVRLAQRIRGFLETL